jgi:hypothetical protein
VPIVELLVKKTCWTLVQNVMHYYQYLNVILHLVLTLNLTLTLTQTLIPLPPSLTIISEA